MRIADEPFNKHVHTDGISGTDYFWNETLLGKMMPFTVIGYINPDTVEQSVTYRPGYIALYERNVKFTNDDQPFKLVYSSPSFDNENTGPILGVFVYEINKNFVPLN